MGATSIAVLVAFAAVMAVMARLLPTDVQGAGPASVVNPMSDPEAARCQVPDWAKTMGHEEMWKLHNNCK